METDSSLYRRTRLEREKAMNAARYPKDSKFGECLLNIRAKEDRTLGRDLGKLNSEYKRLELGMKQLKQTFVKRSKFLNHEPLILMERPASPEFHRRKKIIELGADDPETLKLPGFMRPLKSRSRTPSTLTTIDVFVLNTRKKRNIWEEAMDEREQKTFRSTVKPSAKLTEREMKVIKRGWNNHKAKLEGDVQRSPSPKQSKKRDPTKDIEVFVTQLAKVNHPQTEDGRLVKTVRFKDDKDDNSVVQQSPLPEKKGKKRRKKTRLRASSF